MAKKELCQSFYLKGGLRDEQNVVVRTKNFSMPIETGEVVSQSKIFQDQIADELVILRIDSKITNQDLLEISNKIADEIFMPVTIGGGVDDIYIIESLLSNGADKVSINTNAVLNPKLISTASINFGSSTVSS